MNTKEFIEKAKLIHGDKYDYSQVIYEKSQIKVTIICPEHGEFKQTTNKHLMGQGCPECGKILQAKKHSLNAKNAFQEKANKIHKYKYDYSKTNYLNSKTKVCIICPIHGEFWQTPNNHLQGQGCPKCAIINTHKVQKKSKDQFILDAKRIHGNIYDYSKVNYINGKTKVCIICPIHGEFEQAPSKHLSGHGCPKCGGSLKSNTKEFIEKSCAIHQNKYDYTKVNYINAFTKVTITCPIHGDFEQTPHSHLQGCGCPKCNQSHGERFISNYLLQNNISFIEQYQVKVPAYIRERGYVQIDFYLPDYNCFIEYNGEQHYKPIERFGGELKFEKQKTRDNYIKEYCKQHSIYFIEIPYTFKDFEIVTLLNDAIKTFTN